MAEIVRPKRKVDTLCSAASANQKSIMCFKHRVPRLRGRQKQTHSDAPTVKKKAPQTSGAFLDAFIRSDDLFSLRQRQTQTDAPHKTEADPEMCFNAAMDSQAAIYKYIIQKLQLNVNYVNYFPAFFDGIFVQIFCAVCAYGASSRPSR